MVKIRELSLNERAAIKYLREAGLSYAQIAQQVGCSKSAISKYTKHLKIQVQLEKGENLVGGKRAQIEQSAPFAELLES